MEPAHLPVLVALLLVGLCSTCAGGKLTNRARPGRRAGGRAQQLTTNRSNAELELLPPQHAPPRGTSIDDVRTERGGGVKMYPKVADKQ